MLYLNNKIQSYDYSVNFSLRGCIFIISHNEKVLWSGGGFETRPPERLPI
jgi:hypothetical protein